VGGKEIPCFKLNRAVPLTHTIPSRPFFQSLPRFPSGRQTMPAVLFLDVWYRVSLTSTPLKKCSPAIRQDTPIVAGYAENG
jgi:hypothetical protein